MFLLHLVICAIVFCELSHSRSVVSHQPLNLRNGVEFLWSLGRKGGSLILTVDLIVPTRFGWITFGFHDVPYGYKTWEDLALISIEEENGQEISFLKTLHLGTTQEKMISDSKAQLYDWADNGRRKSGGDYYFTLERQVRYLKTCQRVNFVYAYGETYGKKQYPNYLVQQLQYKIIQLDTSGELCTPPMPPSPYKSPKDMNPDLEAQNEPKEKDEVEKPEQGNKDYDSTQTDKPPYPGGVPPNEVKEPTDEAKELTDEAKELTDEAKEQTGEAKEPADGAKEPTDEVKEPTDEAKEPTDEAKEPTSEVKEPTGEVKEPTGEGKEPKDEVKEPKEELNVPKDEVKEPGAEVKEPTDEGKKPTDELKQPTDEEVNNPPAEVVNPNEENKDVEPDVADSSATVGTSPKPVNSVGSVAGKSTKQTDVSKSETQPKQPKEKNEKPKELSEPTSQGVPPVRDMSRESADVSYKSGTNGERSKPKTNTKSNEEQKESEDKKTDQSLPVYTQVVVPPTRKSNILVKDESEKVSKKENVEAAVDTKALVAKSEVKTKEKHTDPCSLPPVTGNCRGYFTKYHYDAVSGTCKKFVYGGCGGNENRFDTEADCISACGKESKVASASAKCKVDPCSYSQCPSDTKCFPNYDHCTSTCRTNGANDTEPFAHPKCVCHGEHWYDFFKRNENSIYFIIIGIAAFFTGAIVLCLACCCAQKTRKLKVPRTLRKNKVSFYKVDDFESSADEEVEFLQSDTGDMSPIVKGVK